VYTSCAFCDGTFTGDGGPSGLGVGRRLAFDEWRGRLWVICSSCSRWNLAPIDNRLDRIEAVARAAQQGHIVASTDQVSLIRWGAYDLVRVGKPPRIEYATWRYGERIKARRREQLKYVVPLTVAAMGAAVAVNVAAGGSVGVFVWQIPNLARNAYTGIVGWRSIKLDEPPVCAHCGARMTVRARHLTQARLVTDTHARMGLLLICRKCDHEGAQLEGADAQVALRRGLTYLNLAKAGKQRAVDAAMIVEGAGGADALVHGMARQSMALRTLRPDRRLALEMALDEQAEVEELERQWRIAEETAAIADGTLSSDGEIEQELRRLKEKRPNQPNG
jgi:ribosomal protein L40E